jgi:hypothetical protein
LGGVAPPPLAVDNCAAVDNWVGQEAAELAELDDAEAVLESEEGFDSDDLELDLSGEVTSDFPFELGFSELLERLSVR